MTTPKKEGTRTAPATTPHDDHRRRLAEIGDDTVALARYLGELGSTEPEVVHFLGHAPTKEEVAAWKEGSRARRLELRAVELDRARRGGKIEDWMR